MVVFILENVSTSLRGELSRWLFEVKAGVFTGKVSVVVLGGYLNSGASGVRVASAPLSANHGKLPAAREGSRAGAKLF